MRKNSFFWKMVRSSISRRKSRMFTALLAIAMGATILSGLVTIYYDIPRQLGKEFRSYGANLIVIPGDASSKIEEKQVQEIRDTIGAQKLVGLAPYIYQNAKINEQPYIVAGTDMEGLKNNSPFWLVSGEWPTKPREVMLGAEYTEERRRKRRDDGDRLCGSLYRDYRRKRRRADFYVKFRLESNHRRCTVRCC